MTPLACPHAVQSRPARYSFSAHVVLSLPGCATTGPDHDPYESMNRKRVRLQQGSGRRGDPARRHSLRGDHPPLRQPGGHQLLRQSSGLPERLHNDLLQGKVPMAFGGVARVAVNSTIGLAGIDRCRLGDGTREAQRGLRPDDGRVGYGLRSLPGAPLPGPGAAFATLSARGWTSFPIPCGSSGSATGSMRRSECAWSTIGPASCARIKFWAPRLSMSTPYVRGRLSAAPPEPGSRRRPAAGSRRRIVPGGVSVDSASPVGSVPPASPLQSERSSALAFCQ